MGAKGGHKPKDASISDNFNPDKDNGLSKAEAAKLTRLKNLELANSIKKQKAEERRILAEQEAAAGGKAPAPPATEDEGDSAYKMLEDMRHVYKAVDGRKKLETMVKKDDRQFMKLAENLIKVETAILTAKIRNKEEGMSGQQVFVIIKGLGEDNIIDIPSEGDIDMKQITKALNPEGGEYDGGGTLQ